MKLVFTTEAFLKKFNSIKNKQKRFKWVEELSNELDNIYRNYTDEEYTDLYNKYDLAVLNDLIMRNAYYFTDNPRIQKSTFKYFILYLEGVFLPFVNKHLSSLRLELYYIGRRELIKKGTLTDDGKYPSHNFNYYRIKSYGDNVFPVLSDKIEYYEFVLLQFKNEYKGIEVIHVWDLYSIEKRDMKKLKAELKTLKTKYRHEMDKRMINNSSIEEKLDTIIQKSEKPKISRTRPFTEPIRIYFNVAFKMNKIPSQTELAANSSGDSISEASWSRLFSKIEFISALLKSIERKLNSKIVTERKKDLLVELKLNIESKSAEYYKVELEKTGKVNKHVPDYNDNIFDDDEDNRNLGR